MINSHASTELIKTFKEGPFNLRPPVTKYHKIWDPEDLLSYLESMDTSKPIQLSMETATLIMLLSGHRVNTLENLKITNIYISETECTSHSTRLPPTTPDLKIISFKPKSMSCNKYHTTSQVSTRKICRWGFLHNNCPTIQAMLKRYYRKMDQRNPLSLASTVEYTRPIVFSQLLRHQPLTKE